MAYAQQTWVDNTTPVDAAHMNHIESGIATVEGEIPAASRLVPTPVVNGQWIKGVGGAAVWQPLVAADIEGAIPSRIAPDLGAIGITDANAPTAAGWYWLTSPFTNGPTGDYVHIQHFKAGANLKQIAYRYVGYSVWQRMNTGGGWTPWQRMNVAAVAGYVLASGAIGSGTGFTAAHPSGGNYTITLAQALGTPIPMVTVAGQSTVIGAVTASSTVVNVYITSPGAWVDANFYFAVFDLST